MEDLIVDALAVFRGWRLAARDTIFDTPRDRWKTWVYSRAPEPEPGRGQPVPKAIELLGCPWCLGAYGAVAVVILRTKYPDLWRPVARALALSALVGLIATNLDREP